MAPFLQESVGQGEVLVIVYLACHGKYPHPTFIPTHLAETQDDNGTTTWPMRGTTTTMRWRGHDSMHAWTGTDSKEPRWASSPAPTTDRFNTASRCHVTVHDMATKQWSRTVEVPNPWRHHQTTDVAPEHTTSMQLSSWHPTNRRQHPHTSPNTHLHNDPSTHKRQTTCGNPPMTTTTHDTPNNDWHHTQMTTRRPQMMTKRNAMRNEHPPGRWCPTHGQWCPCQTMTMNNKGQHRQRWPPVDEWQTRPPPTSGNECLPLCMSPSLSVPPPCLFPLPVCLPS